MPSDQPEPPGGAAELLPEDHVGRLIAGWHAERPDFPVDPVGVVYRVGRLAAHFSAAVDRVFAGAGLRGLLIESYTGGDAAGAGAGLEALARALEREEAAG